MNNDYITLLDLVNQCGVIAFRLASKGPVKHELKELERKLEIALGSVRADLERIND